MYARVLYLVTILVIKRVAVIEFTGNSKALLFTFGGPTKILEELKIILECWTTFASTFDLHGVA